MFRPGGNKVNAGGFDAGMAQYIGQLDHIPASLVESPGEEVPQIVGEHFLFRYPGFLTKSFHLRPNLFSRDTFSASGEKDFTGSGFVFFGVAEQLAAEFPRQQDCTGLAFKGDFRFPGFGRFNGDILHFTDPDASGVDRFQKERKAILPEPFRCFQKTAAVLFGQLPARVAESFSLDTQEFRMETPAHEAEKGVGCRQHGIDGGWVAALR